MIVLLAQFLAFRSSAQVNYLSSILFFVCFVFFFSEKLKEELKKERRAKEEVRISCQSRYLLTITKGKIIATLRTSPHISSFVVYRYSHPYILLLIGLSTSLAILRLHDLRVCCMKVRFLVFYFYWGDEYCSLY